MNQKEPEQPLDAAEKTPTVSSGRLKAVFASTVALVIALAGVITLLVIDKRPPESSPPATSATVPPNAAIIGVPFRATTSTGATADITIQNIHYDAFSEGSTTGFYTMDVLIVGRSSQPFHFSEEDFGFQYAEGPDPYAPDNGNTWRVSAADSTRFFPWLKNESVTTGQQTWGFVPLRVSSPTRRILIVMFDDNATRLVQWLFDPSQPPVSAT